MSLETEGNIIGFFASYNSGETNEELVNSYLWGENGFKNKLSHLKWKNYGFGLQIILFQIYVNPIPYERRNLKEIENYRPKEKAIGIPIILDDKNFFPLSDINKEVFLIKVIVDKLQLLEIKVKRNKLDFDIIRLISDVKKALNYSEILEVNESIKSNISFFQKMRNKFNF